MNAVPTTAAAPAPLSQQLQFKRGALELSLSFDKGHAYASLRQPRKIDGPMLAFATCPLDRVRVDAPRHAQEFPVLWLASAAFDLRPAEVPRLQKALESLTTKPDAAASH